MKIQLKVLDYVVIALSTTITLVCAFAVYSGSQGKTSVSIEGKYGSWLFLLDGTDETVSVEGPLGDTVLKIEDGTVKVLSSPCINQTCVSAGKIHRHGQWLACLPNEVFVSINSEAPEGELDALAW